jgi:hypothetical protein
MSGITLAQAEAQLTLWLNASTAIASGQEYSIGDRQLKRADLAEVNNSIKMWQQHVTRLSGGRNGMRVRGVTPV